MDWEREEHESEDRWKAENRLSQLEDRVILLAHVCLRLASAHPELTDELRKEFGQEFQ